jgi:uncharacterized protein (DUF427 family)
MNNRQPRLPGPDHPISIEPNAGRVIVRAGGRVIADSHNALALKEAGYPPVLYIPRSDADMSLLQLTDHTSYCPYKGDAKYYSIPLGGAKSVNAVWSYEAPYAAVSGIGRHLAFYPDRVDSILNQPDAAPRSTVQGMPC